ncbi:MAG: glycosyltransferase [Planctomycetes bacterium]|nr:glycosyltransferase [Planctomycetota bacterium]
MARILIYAPAATAAGGIRYLSEFLARIGPARPQDQFTACTPVKFVEGFRAAPSNVRFVPVEFSGLIGRAWWDLVGLGRLVRREACDLIVATGGFAMPHPPRPQILMNYNALYFSPIHEAELRRRGLWRQRIEMKLRRAWALRSMYGSTINIVPTRACGDLIAGRSRRPIPGIRAIYHGFDPDEFVRLARPLNLAQRARLQSRPEGWRLLLASHYNYFRNFETVLRALAVVRQAIKQPIQLVLTTILGIGLRDHGYDTTEAAKLIHTLRLEDAVIMLGPVAQDEIATLHSLCNAVISPAYIESFGYPMVEAMGCGRPVIAADTPVHREVCQDAAVYFSVFDADALAARIVRFAEDRKLADQLAARGRQRVRQFSWADHIRQLGECFDECLGRSNAMVTAA